MVGGQFDRALVEGCEEGLGERDFGHDGTRVGGVQGIVFRGICQIGNDSDCSR